MLETILGLVVYAVLVYTDINESKNKKMASSLWLKLTILFAVNIGVVSFIDTKISTEWVANASIISVILAGVFVGLCIWQNYMHKTMFTNEK